MANINDIKNEVQNCLNNKFKNLIYDFESNLAQLINSEIKEYDLDWCEEDGNSKCVTTKDEIVEEAINKIVKAELEVLFKYAN